VTSDKKLAESVRNYPVLYDKSCAGFRKKLKKKLQRALRINPVLTEKVAVDSKKKKKKKTTCMD